MLFETKLKSQSWNSNWKVELKNEKMKLNWIKLKRKVELSIKNIMKLSKWNWKVEKWKEFQKSNFNLNWPKLKLELRRIRNHLNQLKSWSGKMKPKSWKFYMKIEFESCFWTWKSKDEIKADFESRN